MNRATISTKGQWVIPNRFRKALHLQAGDKVSAHGASFGDAQTALRAILQLKSHRFRSDAVSADSLPALANGKDVTDAHLVRFEN